MSMRESLKPERRNKRRLIPMVSTGCILFALGVFHSCGDAQTILASRLSQQPATPTAQQANLLLPFWSGSRMSNEPVFFLQEPGETLAAARLLFVPSKILSLSNVNGTTDFVEGTDYTWKPGSDLLTLTPGSRIPFKTQAEMHPPIGSPQSIGKTQDGKASLFFEGNGPTFQDLQPLATYDHSAAWTGHIPASATTELARTMAKLKTKQPINIVLLGDSISTGAGASSAFHQFPYQPGYGDIVADGLRFLYGGPVSVTNLSEGGQTSEWGVTMAAKVAAAKPDLVILAFGMNDGSRRMTAATYNQNIQSIITAVRAALPQTDFILVATMTANQDWDMSAPALYSEYLEGFLRAKQPGIAVADLTTTWRDLLKVKKFSDITANGVNHPNDFGHRVYAQVILQLLQ
jgi:acyl-CoA thioesterase-1